MCMYLTSSRGETNKDEDKFKDTEKPHKNPDSSAAGGDADNFGEYITIRKSAETSMRSHHGLTEPHCSRTIDEDLQKMHVNLKESYDLFQTIGERFENINFGCLKSRIKDLHLNENNNDTIKTIVNDLKNSFDQRYMDNRLSDLTKEVSCKFRKHPGEFGDIPELSEFFRACAQLQHGLERLKKERRSVQDLTMRMNQVAEQSYSRIDEMQNKYKEGRFGAEVENEPDHENTD